MYEKVSNWFDLVALEHRILEFWEKNDIFKKLVKMNKDKEAWSFIDGPITANNPMGVHHAWGRALKDVYNRYWAMNGRDLRYQNGFDCQGLWVEVEVEKELGFNTKREIEEYGIGNFVNKCKERVIKYSSIISEQSKRLGFWMDWDNSYFTMSDENNYTIWNFLKKCHERGLIYKGHDVMPWCPRCGTGMSQHEMSEGYRDVKHTSLYIKFPVIGKEKTALLVWTTTPWTLTSNTAAAVHPDLKYSIVKHDGWTYYIIKERVEAVFKKGTYKVTGEISGKELIGMNLKYTGPFDELPAQKKISNSPEYHTIIPWDEVTTGEGTGIVHIAPGCGQEDNQLGKEFSLPLVDPIDESGNFYEGFGWLTNKYAGEAAQSVINDLEKKEIFIKSEEYEHRYPHCWRCGSELLYRLVDEWYISMDSWREDIKNVAKQIKWIPSFGLSQELDWLNNMEDWMISKKRYWGLALPVWECHKCGKYHVIGGYEELKEKAVEGFAEVEKNSPHRPWIDAVKIKCEGCGVVISRIPDVGNPWLDAGIVPYSTVKYNTDREYWKKWVPADLVLESFPGQFRNWFYSLLAMSTMMENIPPFKTLVGYATMKDENGEEMHKSKGNAIWFEDAAEEIGVEVMRWQFFSHEISTDLLFGYTNAKIIRGNFFNTFWNCYAFYANYARLVNFKPMGINDKIGKMTDFDKWILTKLQGCIRRCNESMKEYDVRTASRNIEEFTIDLSNWYIRHNRRRYWKADADSDSIIAYETLFHCLYTVIRLVAPMLPMLSEEMYQNIARGAGDNPESVHLTDYPVENAGLVDEKLSSDMDVIVNLTNVALSMRNQSKIKVRQPLSEFILFSDNESEKSAVERFSEMIESDLNIKKVIISEDSNPPVEFKIEANWKQLGPKFGERTKQIMEEINSSKDLIRQLRKNDAQGEVALKDGKINLDPGDIKIAEKAPEHLIVTAFNKGYIALNKTLTPELIIEGWARDIIRNIQVLRKDIGLELEDRITISYFTESEDMRRAMKTHNDIICRELLCQKITASVSADVPEGKTLTINRQEIIVGIRKE